MFVMELIWMDTAEKPTRKMKKITRFESVKALKESKSKNIDPALSLKRHADVERFLREIYNSKSQNRNSGRVEG